MTAAVSPDSPPTGSPPDRRQAEAGADAPPRPSRKSGVIVGAVAAVALGVGGWAFVHRGIESTDDAQIDAEVVGLAARTSGVVQKVNFEDNERVTVGRVLLE